MGLSRWDNLDYLYLDIHRLDMLYQKSQRGQDSCSGNLDLTRLGIHKMDKLCQLGPYHQGKYRSLD